jgi:hypothetical protein
MTETIKQNWTEVKKYIKYCSEKDLIGIIQDLYKLNKPNKEYLHLKFLAGNNKIQKEKLIVETIADIKYKWSRTFHDPYGYGGNTERAVIGPVKAPVITYKKAIGVDDGYIKILAEYIINGDKCLDQNCAEPSDTIINSINSMAKELFELIKTNSQYIDSLTKVHIHELEEFMNSYHARDEAIMAYRGISFK